MVTDLKVASIGRAMRVTVKGRVRGKVKFKGRVRGKDKVQVWVRF